MLGIPKSELVLYLPEITLSYLNNLSWSLVNRGFGNNWNILADKLANGKGKGINNLFLPIKLSNLSKTSLNDNTFLGQGRDPDILKKSIKFKIWVKI